MRSRDRDRNTTVTFGASIVDAASGSGLAQPGNIPFTFTRGSTGVYTLYFDPRLIPIHGVANPTSVTLCRFSSMSAGVATAVLENPAGTLANGSFRFSITAYDRRT